MDISGGTAPYQLTYRVNEQVYTAEAATAENVVIDVLENGTVVLDNISDANCDGITTDIAIMVECVDYEKNTYISSTGGSCPDEAIELTLELPEGISAEDVVWISSGQGSFDPGQGMVTIYQLVNTSGSVEIQAQVTVNGNSFTVIETIDILDPPVATFSVSPETIYTNNVVTFTPSNLEYAGYTWMIDDQEFTETVPTYVFEQAGVYEITLITEENGCSSEYSQTIEVLLQNNLFVPNVMNPTASNPENRVVKVYGSNINEGDFRFRILNRWGNLLYETRSFSEANTVGWSGANQSSEEEQNLTTFTYILTGSFTDGTPIEETGTITLLR